MGNGERRRVPTSSGPCAARQPNCDAPPRRLARPSSSTSARIGGPANLPTAAPRSNQINSATRGRGRSRVTHKPGNPASSETAPPKHARKEAATYAPLPWRITGPAVGRFGVFPFCFLPWNLSPAQRTFEESRAGFVAVGRRVVHLRSRAPHPSHPLLLPQVRSACMCPATCRKRRVN